MIDIPQRASNDSDFKTLSKIDKQIIAYKVLHNASNQDAFRLFHPEYLDSNGRLNAAGQQDCKFFFNYGKNREYIEAYTKTVEEYINGSKADNTFNADEDIDGDALARKILSDLAAMIKNGRIQDYEVLKIATDILNKYGVLKGAEEKQIPPIRVLPALCKAECRYRLFCETAKANGLMIDDCDYCKARAYAEERGFKYDPTTVLDLPEDVIAKIDEHNNVKLTDILEGKIEN